MGNGWHEWPLMVFTVFGQCVVGGFIVLALALMTGKLSREQEQRVVGSMFGLWALMGIGFIASTMHLGSPLRAFNSLNRVGASALSNEIASGSVFFAVGGFWWLLSVLGKMPAALGRGWLLLGMVLGLFNGALVAFAGLPPFIVTLGTYTALRGAAYLLADGTTVINSNISFEWIGNNYLGPVPWLVVIALAVVVVCWFILRRTTLGVHIYAVGGNMQAARLTGIKVWLVLLFVYGMSGLLSGLGGVMSASRLYSANGNLGMGYELDAIAAVILGGTSFVGGIGTITGTLVGALIIATLNNGMTLMGVSYFWQLVIKGAVIIIAVLIDKYRTRHHQSA